MAPNPAVGVDYARAVTAKDLEVGQRLALALAGPAGGRPFDRARVQLAYGRWLRRQHQRLEARESLREACSIFDQLGNKPFGQQARAELRAAGEATLAGRSSGLDHLTPQELQIARLVADGQSNKEIGERLFLSHRTISSHLYRVFPKLGITTRAQLAAAIRSL